MLFSCDVWSVCSHEVRLEEKGDEMGRGKTLEKRAILILGSCGFHLPHYLTFVFYFACHILPTIQYQMEVRCIFFITVRIALVLDEVSFVIFSFSCNIFFFCSTRIFVAFCLICYLCYGLLSSEKYHPTTNNIR